MLEINCIQSLVVVFTLSGVVQTLETFAWNGLDVGDVFDTLQLGFHLVLHNHQVFVTALVAGSANTVHEGVARRTFRTVSAGNSLKSLHLRFFGKALP
jgi:hypothetical protein